MEHLVVLTGAGISQESGISTFRDSNGLWENHKIEDVATPAAWHRNKSLVLEFYNLRRAQLLKCYPNAAHLKLKELEKHFKVSIITQNVDDLHERAGSTNVLHLHGELRKSRSTVDANLTYWIEGDRLDVGDKCEKGSQLRPDIVWFGEMVPKFEDAIVLASKAYILLIVGTSLAVYPANQLATYVPIGIKKYLIDPYTPENVDRDFILINEKATKGMEILSEILLGNS